MSISLRSISSFFFSRQSKILKEINSNALLCEWLEKNPSPIFFERRHDLYQYINDTLIDNQPIDYLEFGVSKGTTMTQWLKLNKNKGACASGSSVPGRRK